MPLTPEQRAATNRQNAAKSTGPRTDRGKAASRCNATRHGLRAVTLAMPNEDPEAVAARSDAWDDYYRPQSPAAQHLVNQCVAATLMADRCARSHDAAVAKQVRDADFDWDTDREEAVHALVAMLAADPVTAARRLPLTGHGCRWLIGRWEALVGALDVRGVWTGPERDEAIRLQGLTPDAERIKGCPDAWQTRLFNLMCHEDPSSVAIEWMFKSHHLPDLFRGDYRPDSLPLRENCLRALREMASDRLASLRDLEASHREHGDDPDRAGAADRALTLRDGPTARLFLRYHAEARTAFHRAYGSLVKTLELDAAAAAGAAAPAVSPNEPDAPPSAPDGPPAPAEAVSPNEPDPALPGEAKPRGQATPGTPHDTVSRPESPARPPADRLPSTRHARTGGETPAPERRVA